LFELKGNILFGFRRNASGTKENRSSASAQFKKRVTKGISTLLRSMNWRPHLVACIAILKLERELQVSFIDTLWEKSTDSWVSQQILATLSIINEDFIDNFIASHSSRGLEIPQNYTHNPIDEFIKELRIKDSEIIYLEWRKEILKLLANN